MAPDLSDVLAEFFRNPDVRFYLFELPTDFLYFCTGRDASLVGLLGSCFFLAHIAILFWLQTKKLFLSAVFRWCIYILICLPATAIVTVATWGMAFALLKFICLELGCYYVPLHNTLQFLVGLRRVVRTVRKANAESS